MDHHLSTAALILLLVSKDFLASDLCMHDMHYALQRRMTGDVQVIPILLHPCDWQSFPFAALSIVPTGEKPVILWDNRDDAWMNVVKGIRQAPGQ